MKKSQTEKQTVCLGGTTDMHPLCKDPRGTTSTTYITPYVLINLIDCVC